MNKYKAKTKMDKFSNRHGNLASKFTYSVVFQNNSYTKPIVSLLSSVIISLVQFI